MFLKSDDLLKKASKYQKSIHEVQYAEISKAQKTAFLCHSHKDAELVKGLIVWLREEGIELYIDWQDHSLPEVPSAETARKLQKKIESYKLFLFLATGNSTASRWCPWEIGYADSSKRNIYIIPTSESSNTYGSEYLELYPRIERGFSESIEGFSLFEVGKSKGPWLSDAIGKI